MLFFQLAELIKATVHTHRIYETQRSSQLAGFRVEFSEFCAILTTDSLRLLVSLVHLNSVRIRLLQYLSAKEILP